jgi:hypothetical protein
MRLPVFTLFVMLLFSCSKKKEAADPGSLTGRWQLTEYYISSGGSNVQWVEADPGTPSFVEFTQMEKMIFSGGTQPQRVYDYDTVTPGHIVAQTDSTTVLWGYEFDNAELILSGGGCIEACLFKYKRVPASGY